MGGGGQMVAFGCHGVGHILAVVSQVVIVFMGAIKGHARQAQSDGGHIGLGFVPQGGAIVFATVSIILACCHIVDLIGLRWCLIGCRRRCRWQVIAQHQLFQFQLAIKSPIGLGSAEEWGIGRDGIHHGSFSCVLKT